MIEAIENFIVELFNGNSFWATFFISMVPVIELKGAVPFGMSKEIFGENALSPVQAWVASATGSLVPAFFLVWLFVPIMNWLKNTKAFKNMSARLEQKFSENAKKIEEKSDNSKIKTIKKLIGLMLFVAIPLPLTGAYTGSAIAGYLNMGYINSVLAIFIGNIIAGGIVVLLCTIFAGYEAYIFGVFILLLLGFICYKIVKKFYSKKQKLRL